MILDHRFADTFTEQMLDISKLREDENIDEISRKIIDLCDLDLNFSSELWHLFLHLDQCEFLIEYWRQ